MTASSQDLRFRFSIDRGGTFTDLYCEVVRVNSSNGATTVVKALTHKLLSEDPKNYEDAPTEGIRRLLEGELGMEIPRRSPLPTSQIDYIRMGTTVATNALLERKGERIALLTTAGFGDLQVIGNQSRPKIFDLEIRRPTLLYEKVFEVNERVTLVTGSNTPSSTLDTKGVSGEDVRIEQELSETEIANILREIKKIGITTIAIAFMHGYTFPDHELKAKEIALTMGFSHVSTSSEVMPMVRIVPRGCTTCVDAYLTPIIKRYLDNFCSGFDENISKVNITFMQSDGGLTPMHKFDGSKAILSGPAGGVVGYAMTSYKADRKKNSGSPMPVIGFDMGGTSTDVSRYAGSYEHIFETITAGVTVQSPQLDINTVAAGGGSRLFYRNGLFVVGPESAGAHPGPVCYRKGGVLAVTDANVVLGRIQPELFPAIFGENENEQLDKDGARSAFEILTHEINMNNSDRKPLSIEEVAYGFIHVANEAMARPIRNLTTMKGYDVTKHALSCFGGAGPQHCCAIAKSLGMRKIYVHRYSGILSAHGLSLANVVVEKQEPFSGESIESSQSDSTKALDRLEAQAREDLMNQGFLTEQISVTRFLNCRYKGTDTSLMTSQPDADTSSTFKGVFIENYRREYGFELENRAVLVDDVRVRAVGAMSDSSTNGQSINHAASHCSMPPPKQHADVYFGGGIVKTPIFLLNDLPLHSKLTGPCIIIQDVATVVVEPGCEATITEAGDIEIVVLETTEKRITSALDPIYLSIFSHRFMGIAEQMGRTLQRTSISVNIKERLDFSCALFDPNGGLVANAPHLPVHLGAMSEAVRFQISHWQGNWKEGDVLVSNHPQKAGGSHLPDITVITPIFSKGQVVFFVASRGHHADVGGIAPGSMPPLSKTLSEEGAAILSFKLVENGIFQEQGITELLRAPCQHEGNYGTRNLGDNLSDLRAQVAANTRGATLMHELVMEYTLPVIQAYMVHIQDCAERAVRKMLVQFSIQQGLAEVGCVYAEDHMDDGTPICLSIIIDRRDGSAVFDFEGTGPEIYGNLNTPKAVTASAIIYCLRCLLPEVDIPLNQGCLAPITIEIPNGCLLNPSADAAVVGGNVLTSQRVTDVVLKAFQACAASQGCMNNLTFGNATMGYYETIAGGAGAGPSWHGCSGVHTHMTNTRITDPEILEKRYPVILRKFGLRKGSGGSGKFIGGDGVVRVLEFTEKLTMSILSERRAFQPYGMDGGSSGERGKNTLYQHTKKKWINLGGKNTIEVYPGDRLQIKTPGGGGYGECDTEQPNQAELGRDPTQLRAGGSLFQYQANAESA